MNSQQRRAIELRTSRNRPVFYWLWLVQVGTQIFWWPSRHQFGTPQLEFVKKPAVTRWIAKHQTSSPKTQDTSTQNQIDENSNQSNPQFSRQIHDLSQIQRWSACCFGGCQGSRRTWDQLKVAIGKGEWTPFTNPWVHPDMTPATGFCQQATRWNRAHPISSWSESNACAGNEMTKERSTKIFETGRTCGKKHSARTETPNDQPPQRLGDQAAKDQCHNDAQQSHDLSKNR